MPRDVMRSTSRARLALCAKVAGVSGNRWFDATRICDARPRWVRDMEAQMVRIAHDSISEAKCRGAAVQAVIGQAGHVQ